jgi:hypothetical protein
MKKRQSLADIMKPTTPTAPMLEPADGARTPPLFGDNRASQPRGGKIQLSVRITPELKQRVKLKAIRSNKSVEDVVSELLEAWTRG